MHPADVALCAWESFSLDRLAAQTARPCFDPWLKTASCTFIMLLFQALSRVLACFTLPSFLLLLLFVFVHLLPRFLACHEGRSNLLSPKPLKGDGCLRDSAGWGWTLFARDVAGLIIPLLLLLSLSNKPQMSFRTFVWAAETTDLWCDIYSAVIVTITHLEELKACRSGQKPKRGPALNTRFTRARTKPWKSGKCLI